MLVSRIFTVFAAILLVVTFGLILLTPYDLPLKDGIASVAPALLTRLHDGVVHLLGGGLWAGVIVPLLGRPVWLIPLALGMVCVGIATTTNAPPTARRTRRRS